MDEGHCRSCPQRVLWVKMHPSGKPNPLDPEPTEAGNVLVVGEGYEHPGAVDRFLFDTEARDGRGVALKKDQLAIARAEGRKLYVSHFATCPNRDQHRKTAKRA